MKHCVTILVLAGLLVSCGGGGDDSASGGGGPAIADSGAAPSNSSGTAPANDGGTPPSTGSNTPPPSGGSTPPPAGGSTPPPPDPSTGGSTPPPPDPSAGGSTPPPPDPSTGGSTPPPADDTTPPPTGGSNPPPSAGTRFEESDAAAVTLSEGHWTRSNSNFGWSGGTAMQTIVAGATASFIFTGTSVRWIGWRSKRGGMALVKVDEREPIEVDLYSEPNEVRTPIITLYDLGEGQHTLTIQVMDKRNSKAVSNIVTVDAFEVEPQILSRFQEMDPDVLLTAGWTQDPTSTWSGGGVISGDDPLFGGMRFAASAGEKATVKFRGTSIAWSGYRGPDGGIAMVQLDEEQPREIDTYSAKVKNQVVVFSRTGLADKEHKLTIEVTGRRNAQSSGTKIVLDAFEVTRPGKRYQEWHRKIEYSGHWTRDNDNRPWSEGRTATSNLLGTSATFTFTGTSVSWIGAQKRSIGKSNIYLDGKLVEEEISNKLAEPNEAYQREIYKVDNLAPGEHQLRIEPLGGGYTVVDAFDVHPETGGR